MCSNCEKLKDDGLCPATCEESKRHFKYAVRKMKQMFRGNHYQFIRAKLDYSVKIV